MVCASCFFLDVPMNAAGKRVVRKNKTYRCLAEIPNPVLPESVKQSAGWHWPPSRSFMHGDDGEGCECHSSLSSMTYARTVKPWHDYQGRPSYGPSALFYMQTLCYQVADRHNRPVARELIKRHGGADYIAAVEPIDYPKLINACRKALA